jgi:hypothetical protein
MPGSFSFCVTVRRKYGHFGKKFVPFTLDNGNISIYIDFWKLIFGFVLPVLAQFSVLPP